MSTIEKYKYLLTTILFGFLNVLGSEYIFIGIFSAFVQYIIVVSCVMRNKLIPAFLYFILFTSISLEHKVFVQGDDFKGSIYNFLSLPILSSIPYYIIIIYLYYKLYIKDKIGFKPNDVLSKFLRYVNWITVTGVITIVFAMLVDDNGIITSGNYPKVAILRIYGFVPLYCMVFIAASTALRQGIWRYLSDSCVQMICGFGIVGILSFVSGFHGYYGVDEIMQAPLSIAFVPCLLLFNRENCQYKLLPFVICIMFCLCSFLLPNAIGSKWYLIIMASLVLYVAKIANIRTWYSWILILLAAIAALYFTSEVIMQNVGGNDFVLWKLSQTINLINVFQYESASDWFEGMDHSPLFRFDEIANIAIEYWKKPIYFIFGKGFGGTVVHSTTLLSWETAAGAFSELEIKMRAYFAMHETVAQIFLQHGLFGLFFIRYGIKLLFQKISYTPWALIGLIWFFFYWSYGVSLRLGLIGMILALTYKKD